MYCHKRNLWNYFGTICLLAIFEFMHQPACFSSSRHTSTTVALSKFPKGFLCRHRPTPSHMYTKRMHTRSRTHTNTHMQLIAPLTGLCQSEACDVHPVGMSQPSVTHWNFTISDILPLPLLQRVTQVVGPKFLVLLFWDVGKIKCNMKSVWRF